jgi:hypothetical protein
MKTIKLFSLLAATGFLTMSMGFPTNLTEKGKSREAEGCTEARVVNIPEKKPARVVPADMVEEDPAQAVTMPGFAADSGKITLKVFNTQGALVLNEQVSMHAFLARDKKASLPAGSTFVMFHANTAYYFLEAGLAE